MEEQQRKIEGCFEKLDGDVKEQIGVVFDGSNYTKIAKWNKNVIACFGMHITLHSLLLYGSIGMSATLLAGGISLPCAYLFDPEKSQIVFMMSFMASTGYYLMNIG
ncbi:hypothetical protein C806_03629 [Lachnospiraceae bacterium 3-1]|nr:hypothetical protein C806_03629 [Lachnospiraceae bacterium 3-1]